MWNNNWNAAGPSSGSNWQQPSHNLTNQQQANVAYYYNQGHTDPVQLANAVGSTPDQVQAFLAEQGQAAQSVAAPVTISEYSSLAGALGHNLTNQQQANVAYYYNQGHTDPVQLANAVGSTPDQVHAFLAEQQQAAQSIPIASSSSSWRGHAASVQISNYSTLAGALEDSSAQTAPAGSSSSVQPSHVASGRIDSPIEDAGSRPPRPVAADFILSGSSDASSLPAPSSFRWVEQPTEEHGPGDADQVPGRSFPQPGERAVSPGGTNYTAVEGLKLKGDHGYGGISDDKKRFLLPGIRPSGFNLAGGIIRDEDAKQGMRALFDPKTGLKVAAKGAEAFDIPPGTFNKIKAKNFRDQISSKRSQAAKDRAADRDPEDRKAARRKQIDTMGPGGRAEAAQRALATRRLNKEEHGNEDAS
jgi:hypothetical protein